MRACKRHILFTVHIVRIAPKTYASTSAAASLPYKNVPYKSVIQPNNTFWKFRFPTHISGRFTESIIPLDNTLTKICNVRDNTFRQFYNLDMFVQVCTKVVFSNFKTRLQENQSKYLIFIKAVIYYFSSWEISCRMT